MLKNCIEVRMSDEPKDWLTYCVPDFQYPNVDFTAQNDITPFLIAFKEILSDLFDRNTVDLCITMPDELKESIVKIVLKHLDEELEVMKEE